MGRRREPRRARLDRLVGSRRTQDTRRPRLGRRRRGREEKDKLRRRRRAPNDRVPGWKCPSRRIGWGALARRDVGRPLDAHARPTDLGISTRLEPPVQLRVRYTLGIASSALRPPSADLTSISTRHRRRRLGGPACHVVLAPLTLGYPRDRRSSVEPEQGDASLRACVQPQCEQDRRAIPACWRKHGVEKGVGHFA